MCVSTSTETTLLELRCWATRRGQSVGIFVSFTRFLTFRNIKFQPFYIYFYIYLLFQFLFANYFLFLLFWVVLTVFFSSFSFCLLTFLFPPSCSIFLPQAQIFICRLLLEVRRGEFHAQRTQSVRF